MKEDFRAQGLIEVYRVREGLKSLVFSKRQTIDADLYTAIRDKLNNRDSGAARGISIDGITWGSWRHSAGSFIDGTYVGTFSAGTAGGLIRSTPASNQFKVSGTFGFAATKEINYFELGQGPYITPAAGVTQQVTTRYAYDDSLKAATSVITYESGDSLIVDWTLQIGS